MDPLPCYAERPELAVVATLQLLTRYSSTRNPRIAQAAVAQLRAIAQETRLPEALRQCAAGMLGDWERMALPCPTPDHFH